MKQLFRRDDGSEPRCYRLVYNLASLALFGWVMASYRSSAVIYEVPGMWRWVMHAAQLGLSVILFLCVRQTGSGDFLGITQFRGGDAPSHRLVTTGCYARVRHPLYVVSTMILVLNPVMTGRWLLLTLFSLFYFIIGGMIEEGRLLKEFGDDYRRYRQRVPFLIPVLRIAGRNT